ncbi:putative membrane protein [Rhodococcus opacus]|uniref:Putative membrane protein n=1 Tax=Rhodococcus opacus TaxID=37919 RepID=A0A1B1K5L9_RHOOP|nr:putative membrane protein [Rhodococcus opacus]
MHPSLPTKQWIPGGTARLTQPVIGAGASLPVAMPAWMVTNSLWATAAIVAATFAGLIAAAVMLRPSP